METIVSARDGTRVVLRRYRLDDEEGLFEAVRESIPELGAWMFWCHPGYSRGESRAWLEKREGEWELGSSYDFAMVDAESGRLLGGCGLNGVSRVHRMANLGYWVRTGATGRGIATGAARELARFGFEELGLSRIEVVVATGNTNSQRVAEKVGAVREGVLRNRLAVGNRLQDAVMFSLVPGDRKGAG